MKQKAAKKYRKTQKNSSRGNKYKNNVQNYTYLKMYIAQLKNYGQQAENYFIFPLSSYFLALWNIVETE